MSILHGYPYENKKVTHDGKCSLIFTIFNATWETKLLHKQPKKNLHEFLKKFNFNT